MTTDLIHASGHADACTVTVGTVQEYMMAPRARFDVVCTDADGNEKWRDTAYNLVTTAGKNDLLDKYLAGTAYTASWSCGLISLVGFTAIAVADTMASHAGWTEAGATNAPNYSSATRVALTFAAASGASKSTSSASSFTFSAGGTVKGMFASTSPVKDGTAGILYNAVLFTGGDRVVLNTDVVNVSVTYSA